MLSKPTDNLPVIVDVDSNVKLSGKSFFLFKGASDFTINVISSTTTGIDNITSDFGILIYPNPSTGLFTIEKPSDLNKAVQIRVLDATSKLIVEKIIPVGKQKIEIDITAYSSGVYYLQLIVDEEVFVKQILKK